MNWECVNIRCSLRPGILVGWIYCYEMEAAEDGPNVRLIGQPVMALIRPLHIWTRTRTMDGSHVSAQYLRSFLWVSGAVGRCSIISRGAQRHGYASHGALSLRGHTPPIMGRSYKGKDWRDHASNSPLPICRSHYMTLILHGLLFTGSVLKLHEWRKAKSFWNIRMFYALF